jgi:predicted nucleotidyltransferase
MNVFGFSEALASAPQVLLPGQHTIRAVSLCALAMLKIVAWQDRHLAFPRKDAGDLMLVIRNYLRCGNEARLWSELASWAQDDSFDVEQASARMLGLDIGSLLGKGGSERIIDILSQQTNDEAFGRLAQEMAPRDPEFARRLLKSLLQGVQEAG